MDPSAARLQVYRRRIARMLRRAETHPERGALLLREEAGDLLSELRRLARPEPAVVIEVLLVLLERLAEALKQLDDRAGFAAGLLPEVVDRIHGMLRRDGASGAQRLDHHRAIGRLFRLWITDPDGDFQDLDRILFDLTALAADEPIVRDLLREHIRTLPLVFPPPRGATDDLRRALLLAERHRSERLLGEILARRKDYEYSIIVARDHLRRSGDAFDLVAALHRAGRHDEAIPAARRALTSPRSFQRQRLQELLDEMLADAPEGDDRRGRRNLERDFLAAPSLKTWRALQRIVPADQWSRVAKRLLGHLHKHQKAPTLLFHLYLEQGNVLEADGLVVTQAIEPDVLCEAAGRVAQDHPAVAAGWCLFAAHRRAALKKPALYPQIVRDLLRVRDLARQTGQEASFGRALERFRSRFASRQGLLAMLARAGLV